MKALTLEEHIAEVIRGAMMAVKSEIVAEVAAAVRPSSNAVDPEWLSTAQVAERVGVKPETVRDWVKRGELKAERMGRTRGIRVAREELDRFMSTPSADVTHAKVEQLADRLRRLR